MPAILDQLQLDHRNMRQLLRILDEEIDLYHSRGAGDFDLMKQVMEYTLHYPTLVHHPREEMLFRRLAELDPASKDVAGDLMKDHQELARLTHRFAAALNNVAHDVEVPRVLFMQIAAEYLQRSHRHMEAEERAFFPRLVAVFDDADWQNFRVQSARGYDPLFGTSVERHYRALHQRITNTAP